MTPKLKTLLVTLVCVVPLDQATKAWVAARIPADSMADRIELIDGFFYITHARNPGAAFGLLVDWPAEWRLVVFLAVAAVAIAVIVSFYRSLAPGERFNAVALGMILGGSLGNLTDRVVRGEVIDFLHFRLWSGFAWPDFNVADTCIVMGVGGLIIELLASEGASRAARKGGSPTASEQDAGS
jgi:signal peptidase II